jgi:hypothetical protein
MTPNGTYDNRRTMRREHWIAGKLDSWITGNTIEQYRAQKLDYPPIKPFGQLQDLPRCLSCGATFTPEGVLPCGH